MTAWLPGRISLEQYSIRRDACTAQELNRLLASPEFGQWQHQKASREARWSTLLSYGGVAALCLVLGVALSPAPSNIARLEGVSSLEHLLATAGNASSWRAPQLFVQPAVQLREQLSRPSAKLGRAKYKLGAGLRESVDLFVELADQQTQHGPQHLLQQQAEHAEQPDPQQEDHAQHTPTPPQPQHEEDPQCQPLRQHLPKAQEPQWRVAEGQQRPGQEEAARQDLQPTALPQQPQREQQGEEVASCPSGSLGVRPLAVTPPRPASSEHPAQPLARDMASLSSHLVSSQTALLGLLVLSWLGLLCLRMYALLRHLARQTSQLEAQLASAGAGDDFRGATEAHSQACHQPDKPSKAQEEVSSGKPKNHISSSSRSGATSSSSDSRAGDPSGPLTPERRSSPEPAPDSARKAHPTPAPAARALGLPGQAPAAGVQPDKDHSAAEVPNVEPGSLLQAASVPAPVPAAQREAALTAGRAPAPSAQGSEAQAQAVAPAQAFDSGGGPHSTQHATPSAQLEVPRVFQHYLAERGAVALEAARVQELLASAKELAQLKAERYPLTAEGDEERALGGATDVQGHGQQEQQPLQALEFGAWQHASEVPQAEQHAHQGLEALLEVPEPPRPPRDQPWEALEPGEVPAPAAHGATSGERQHQHRQQQQQQQGWRELGEGGAAESSAAAGLGASAGTSRLSSHPVPDSEGEGGSAGESVHDSPQEPLGGSWVSSWVSRSGGPPSLDHAGPASKHPPVDALVAGLVGSEQVPVQGSGTQGQIARQQASSGVVASPSRGGQEARGAPLGAGDEAAKRAADWLRTLGRSRSTGGERGRRSMEGFRRSTR